MPEQTTRTRGIHESSSAGVAKKPALSHAADENVGKTIVVVVTHGHTHSIHLDVEACASRYVRKRAVAAIAVKAQGGSLALVSGPVHAVHKQDVLPAIAVIIEECAASAQRLWKQLPAVSAAVVPEPNTSRVGNIGQLESQGRGGIRERPVWSRCRSQSCTKCCRKKLAPVQGRFTRPLRIA